MSKPIEERLKESVSLLKQIQGMGIQPTHKGYAELKGHLDAWIKEGIAFQGKVDFPDHSYKAILLLPMRANNVSSCKLKHHVFTVA